LAVPLLLEPGPYWTDLDVVTGDIRAGRRRHHQGTGPVALVRPDGHLAAPGRPGHLPAVTGYLRDLFAEPALERIAADQR
jgi:hypothetical protein